jgi:hypothetical protein
MLSTLRVLVFLHSFPQRGELPELHPGLPMEDVGHLQASTNARSGRIETHSNTRQPQAKRGSVLIAGLQKGASPVLCKNRGQQQQQHCTTLRTTMTPLSTKRKTQHPLLPHGPQPSWRWPWPSSCPCLCMHGPRLRQSPLLALAPSLGKFL